MATAGPADPPSSRTTPRHTLYAYVDGSDLEDVAAPIEERLVEFAATPGWVASRPTVANQKTDVSGSHPDDLPDWDLRINLARPDQSDEPVGWFADVERIAGCLAKLHSVFAHEFIIGIADNVKGVTDNLFFVDSNAPDLGTLLSAFSVRGG